MSSFDTLNTAHICSATCKATVHIWKIWPIAFFQSQIFRNTRCLESTFYAVPLKGLDTPTYTQDFLVCFVLLTHFTNKYWSVSYGEFLCLSAIISRNAASIDAILCPLKNLHYKHAFIGQTPKQLNITQMKF